jgi:hypothetical protein
MPEYPGSLLQYGEILVEAQDAIPGNGGKLMGKPSIATAYFEDAERLLGKGKMMDEPLTGSFAKLPVFVLRVSVRQIRELHDLIIQITPDAPFMMAGV